LGKDRATKTVPTLFGGWRGKENKRRPYPTPLPHTNLFISYPFSAVRYKLPATKTTYKYNNKATNKIQTDTLSALKVGWLRDKQVKNSYKFRQQKHQSRAVSQAMRK